MMTSTTSNSMSVKPRVRRCVCSDFMVAAAARQDRAGQGA
jgi:hypothetical protein